MTAPQRKMNASRNITEGRGHGQALWNDLNSRLVCYMVFYVPVEEDSCMMLVADVHEEQNEYGCMINYRIRKQIFKKIYIGFIK